MKTDNPPKGVTARSVSQILIFPPPKSGLNSCQSFCFCTTFSLINAWNRMRLSYHTPTSDFRLKNQEENGAGKICYCPVRRISHEYASHRNYSRSAGFRLHNHPVGRRTTNDVRWIGSLIVSEKQQSQCGIGLVLNSWNATQMLVTLSRASWEARLYTDSIDVFREVAVRPGHKNSAVEFIWPSIPKSSKSVDKVQDAFLRSLDTARKRTQAVMTR
jgi:hypothetical protein